MGAETAVLEATELVGSLVDNLVDSFGSATDLYRRLKRRQQKDEDRRRPRRRRSFHEYEYSHRLRDGDPRRSLNDVIRTEENEEDSFNASGQLVRREYDRGFQEIGKQYTVGDLIAQTQLQAQIIGIQSSLLAVYESSTQPNPPPISHHLTRLLASTRAARTGSISALSQQYQRMIASAPFSVQRALPAPPESSRGSRSRDSGMALVHTKSSSAHTHIQNHGLYCPYAVALQEQSERPLDDAFQTGGGNRCPHCTGVVPLTDGKSWEIIKDDPVEASERVFHIENRFVVKSHRLRKGFACALCSRERSSDCVMDSVRSLIDHVWLDHDIEEYEREADMKELLFR